MSKFTWFISALVLSGLLSGCAVVKKVKSRRRRLIPPRVLVLKVECDNPAVGSAIADGLLDNITKKVEAFNSEGYELIISSITRRKQKYSESEVPPVINFSSATFYAQLEKSQYFRTQVLLETDLDYVIVGKAKEKDLSDLEFGNLITAETASVRMMELKTGRFVVTQSFKQGYFEVVAPERIGKKFTPRINKFLSRIRKSAKREAKSWRK